MHSMKKIDIEIDKQTSPADPPVEAEPLVPLEPATITPEQLEELKDRAAKADDNWERLLRTTADFENLKSALVEAGLEEVDAAGKTFDPNLHEAVSQTETAEVPEGQVLQQLRKGYKLRERLLRPASVVVAKAPVT